MQTSETTPDLDGPILARLTGDGRCSMVVTCSEAEAPALAFALAKQLGRETRIIPAIGMAGREKWGGKDTAARQGGTTLHPTEAPGLETGRGPSAIVDRFAEEARETGGSQETMRPPGGGSAIAPSSKESLAEAGPAPKASAGVLERGKEKRASKRADARA